MSGYLTIDELATYAPEHTVAAGKEQAYIDRASLLIDEHCHRAVGVTTYTERMNLTSGRSHLTYLPVVALTSARARYDVLNTSFYAPYAGGINNGVSNWETIDVDNVDLNAATGVFILPCVTGNVDLAFTSGDLFNTAYNEAELTYTAGYATVPEKVKHACGLLITHMSYRHNPMAVSEKLPNGLQTSYRDGSFITPEIAGLLSKYVARAYR
jgi:hypothetical protein